MLVVTRVEVVDSQRCFPTAHLSPWSHTLWCSPILGTLSWYIRCPDWIFSLETLFHHTWCTFCLWLTRTTPRPVAPKGLPTAILLPGTCWVSTPWSIEYHENSCPHLHTTDSPFESVSHRWFLCLEDQRGAIEDHPADLHVHHVTRQTWPAPWDPPRYQIAPRTLPKVSGYKGRIGAEGSGDQWLGLYQTRVGRYEATCQCSEEGYFGTEKPVFHHL